MAFGGELATGNFRNCPYLLTKSILLSQTLYVRLNLTHNMTPWIWVKKSRENDEMLKWEEDVEEEEKEGLLFSKSGGVDEKWKIFEHGIAW